MNCIILSHPIRVGAGILMIVCLFIAQVSAARDTVHIATFDVDATPPVGSYLTYDRMTHTWDLGLRARGIVLVGSGKPIVLCSVDWIGIANEGQDAFKRILAAAAGTEPQRVAIHTVHQHDAPTCDFGAEALLKAKGMDPINFEGSFARKVLRRLDSAVRYAVQQSQPVTHIGLGKAEVVDVASNRRLVDEYGKVTISRNSSTADSTIRARPIGLIDPMLSLISFWNDERPLAVLSYYAVHPQSYYRTGNANPDFPGVARFMRQLAEPNAMHIHFTGAAGDITAGKFNDGSPVNRLKLATRLADGMKRAWESTVKEPIASDDIGWTHEQLEFPIAPSAIALEKQLADHNNIFLANNVYKLVFSERQAAGIYISLTCLRLGRARILHLPGEPFVAFQLAAKRMRQDLFVAMAGYGDYAPGYICTASAYDEGGYEAGPASGVTAEAEAILLAAMEKLLKQ